MLSTVLVVHAPVAVVRHPWKLYSSQAGDLEIIPLITSACIIFGRELFVESM